MSWCVEHTNHKPGRLLLKTYGRQSNLHRRRKFVHLKPTNASGGWVVERPTHPLARNLHSLCKRCCWERTASDEIWTICPDLRRCSDDFSGLLLMRGNNQKQKLSL